jgi:excisionase family DNA binding protein
VPVEEGGVTTGWDGIVFNVTGQREIEEALTTRLRQQEALLRFSQQTVLQPGLDPLFEEAVRFLAETLRVRFIRLYELRPGGEELFLRAGLGWREGLVGRLVVPADVATQAGYALLANTAVVVPDWRAEQRFTGPAFIREHGIISSLTTIIPGRGKPFGAMGVDSLTRRDFSEHDIVFLESVAAVLANAILSQEPEQPARWFTVSEVAARLQVSEETVRRWARAGELPVIKLGDYRSGYRIHPTDLDNFLRQRYSGGQPVAS